MELVEDSEVGDRVELVLPLLVGTVGQVVLDDLDQVTDILGLVEVLQRLVVEVFGGQGLLVVEEVLASLDVAGNDDVASLTHHLNDTHVTGARLPDS